MKKAVQPVVVCRKGSDPLLQGYRRGFVCVICNLDLQVSPRGIEHLRNGAAALCNVCGFAFVVYLRQEGADFDLGLADPTNEDLRQRLKELLERFDAVQKQTRVQHD